MRAIAARMHDALGNALVVEVEDLLAEMEILDQRRPALADLQRVLVVGNRAALGGRQDLGVALGDLVKFAAIAAHQLLIVDRRGLARRLSSGLGHARYFLLERTELQITLNAGITS